MGSFEGKDMYQVNIFMGSNEVPYTFNVKGTKEYIEGFLRRIDRTYVIKRIAWRKIN
jgi:hypothetical protein